MSSGTYTPSTLCTSTGMPAPSLYTRTLPATGSMSTRTHVIVASRCLLSAALTKISSNILNKPGT